MKLKIDKEAAAMTISFRDERIMESDEIRLGVIADYGYDGNIIVQP